MTDEIAPIESAPEVLTDQDNGATPLRHQPEQKAPEPEAPPQAKSASEAIKAAMAKVEAGDEDPAPAPEKPKEKAEAPAEEKAEDDAPEVEATKKGDDDAGEKEAAKAAQSEGKADKIPSRLLPKEREVWANVPNAVKAAWERMEREHTEASQKYEPAVKLHEELREFDALAKRSNTSIKAALTNYVNAENALRQDFGRGVAQMAQSMGKNPTEAVAQIMRAAGVSPQQLGAYLQGQSAQQPQPQQPQQQRPQVDPTAQVALQRVQQLEAQLAQQQEQARIAQVEADIISPFIAEHPRYEELQGDIAFFLKSGKIPTSLSPVERLEVAYDMAERINPAPVMTSPNLAEPAEITPRAGGKSISGAPGKSSTTSGKPKVMSIRDSIAAAMRSA